MLLPQHPHLRPKDSTFTLYPIEYTSERDHEVSMASYDIRNTRTTILRTEGGANALEVGLTSCR